jgi:hypothetical protein
MLSLKIVENLLAVTNFEKVREGSFYLSQSNRMLSVEEIREEGLKVTLLYPNKTICKEKIIFSELYSDEVEEFYEFLSGLKLHSGYSVDYFSYQKSGMIVGCSFFKEGENISKDFFFFEDETDENDSLSRLYESLVPHTRVLIGDSRYLGKKLDQNALFPATKFSIKKVLAQCLIKILQERYELL